MKGFKWDRIDVRVHTILHEVDDAAPNNLMSGFSEWAMRLNFKLLYPGPMAELPHLRFIEPSNPNKEDSACTSEPYVFVCDFVARSEEYIDVTAEMARGVTPTQWHAMMDLRNELAKDAKIGWFAVHNGDLEVAKQERREELEHGGGAEVDEVAERTEQEEQKTQRKFSEGLNEKVAQVLMDEKADGEQEEKVVVTVDGISYEYLGTGSTTLPRLSNLQPAKPLTVSYDSQYSNFTFAAGPVEVTASFFSSVLPTDLCRTSIPLSYLTTSVQSTDDAKHDVSFYSDVNAAWAASENNVTIQWELYEGSSAINGSRKAAGGPSSIYSWLVHLQQAYDFAEEMDVALWGNFTYSSSPMNARVFGFQSGFSGHLRYQYVMQHSLQDIVDTDFRPFATRDPVFAYAHGFGAVSSASVRYTIGSVQQPLIRYLSSQGVVPLQPWWSQCYGEVHQMISFHFNDFDQTQFLASGFETQLQADVEQYYSANVAMILSNSTPGTLPSYANSTQGHNGTGHDAVQPVFDPSNGYGFLDSQNFSGVAIPDIQEVQAYYSIVALSARQVMGAYVLAVPPSSDAGSEPRENATEPLMFQKEISSNGNVNTVDVMFPAMPFFLYANPDLLRYTMEPLYQNQEGGFYPNEYSMHDLGTHFPNATGHVEGDDEYMPVEESGNMILMSYAFYKFSSNTTYLRLHYPKLQQFASYLVEYSLTPGNQLSTDDFAGQLVNQTNLAIKGIVGLAAMAEIASLTDHAEDAAKYSSTATSFYQQWETLAIAPEGTHTLLSYQWRSSYSLLYNIYPALLLNLSVIPDSLYEMQSSFYPSVSQIFGVPLDNRHSYTKSDESLWTAATCSPETRRLFVNALGYWLNATSTDRPFTDLFETIGEGGYPVSPTPISLSARPVAGGHFSLLALEKGRRVNGG
ncbi:MAG: hypothetical protein Q9207_005741 [Kuettlingeria erythrocarpa]